MPRYSHEGLSLWYSTPDAPAPDGVEVDRTAVALTVGVQPSSPNNTVTVRYRVDGGAIQLARAILCRTDHERNAQYFTATLPEVGTGTMVEYLPVLSCAGRQVPDPATANTLPSSFRLHGPTLTRMMRYTGRGVGTTPDLGETRFPFTLEHLARVRVHSRGLPEIIGPTPEGIRVNWHAAGGDVIGPALRAKVSAEGEHGMLLRPDGVGIFEIRVTLETDDGALIWVAYSGVLDLGADGYQRLLDGKWPVGTPTVLITPRFLTGHPKYQWLNRLQCLGVGEVVQTDHLYAYDLYAIR